MRTRLNRKPKTYLDLKAKTWYSVFIILILMGMVTTLFYYFNQYNKQLVMVAKVAYARTPDHEYKVPELNPDLTERQQNIDLIKRIWKDDQEIGLAIAKCESGYRTHASNNNTNGTVDQGIFQMNSVHNMPEMDSAVANISTAYLMYQQQGTTPWDSSKKCWN